MNNINNVNAWPTNTQEKVSCYVVSMNEVHSDSAWCSEKEQTRAHLSWRKLQQLLLGSQAGRCEMCWLFNSLVSPPVSLSTNWSDVRWRVTGPTWWCSYLLFACWQMVNINNQSKSMLTPTGVKINEESGESWRPAVCLLLCAGVERATHSVWTRFQTEVIPKNIFCFGLLWGKLYLYKIIIKHE